MSVSKQSIECESTQIERVTVFPDRAEIRRRVPLKLQQGINEIIIENVLGKFLEETVRVSGSGNALIHEIEVGWKNRSNRDQEKPEEAADLRRIVNDCEKAQNWMKIKKNLLNDKMSGLQILCKNSINSTSTESKEKSKESNFVVNSKTLEGFRELLDFYEKQGIEFAKEEQALVEEEEKCKEKAKEARANLDKYLKEEKIRIIKVFLETEDDCDADLFLSYQVTQAHWRPFYDIRVDSSENDEQKINITYFGRVTQQSGEKWNGCQLVLSTAIPSLGGSLPSLGTMNVSFKEKPQPPQFVADSRTGESGFRAVSFGMAQTDSARIQFVDSAASAPFVQEAPRPEMTQVTATVEEQTLASEFTIARLVTIPSDGGEHKVTIGVAELKTNLSRECVPMKNTNVFLTASTTNTSSLSFLPGEAAVFFDRNFVNKIKLKSISPGERFSLSLGVDPSVKVQYQPAHSKHGETGIISKWNTSVKEQKIVVKNTRNETVLVTFYEQIPRSSNEKIVVKLVEPESKGVDVDEEVERKEGAWLNSRTNNLEWTVKIGAQGKEELSIKYQIDYPLGEQLKYIERAQARFDPITSTNYPKGFSFNRPTS